MSTTAPDLDTAAVTAAGVLDVARGRRAAATPPRLDLLQAAVEWADLHPAESIHDAALLSRHGDQPFAVAGPGAPLVAEFCVAEFALAVGLPTETGKAYLGEAVELRHRLPRTWARVVSGDLAAWRARRIARETIGLSAAAAGFVDTKVAPYAHRIRPAEVDRLVADAVGRFMPAEAEKLRRQAADGRYLAIEHTQVSFVGTSRIHGELDLADALDLETRIAHEAAVLAACGSEETLDVRRSQALGQIARQQTSLDLACSRPRRPSRCPADRGPRPPLPGRPVRPRRSLRPPAGDRRAGPRVAAHPADRGRHQAGGRRDRAPARRPVRGPHQARRPDRRARPHLCVSLVHPPRGALRRRPRHPLQRRRHHQQRQPRVPVSQTPPAEDPPLRLELHRPRTRHPTCGHRRMATSSSATTAAPPTSAETSRPTGYKTGHTTGHPTPEHTAPHPAIHLAGLQARQSVDDRARNRPTSSGSDSGSSKRA